MGQSAAEPLQTSRLEFPDNDRVRALCGAHNEHLKLVEKRLGVQLGLRGGQIVVAAADEAKLRMAEGLLRELYDLVESGYPLYLEDVDQATKLAAQGVPVRDVFGDTVFVSSRHRVITPKGLAQKRYIQAIRDDDLPAAEPELDPEPLLHQLEVLVVRAAQRANLVVVRELEP